MKKLIKDLDKAVSVFPKSNALGVALSAIADVVKELAREKEEGSVAVVKAPEEKPTKRTVAKKSES